jgi:small subunit ribosomal protein S8
MTIEHPVADMLTRIRNASRRFHAEVSMSNSKVREAIAGILKEEGYIDDYEVLAAEPQPLLRIRLKYRGERGDAQAAISGIKLVSKPSRRVYAGKDEIPQTLAGLGISIVSTSRGIMSGGKAQEQGIGGEVLCEVW